ncbi:MAG: FtsX-like permease family protein, partial [Bacteroidota bacterium]
ISISSKRMKEIGIRKVMGSSRKQLIFQFMGENMVLVFLSILFSLAVASFLVPLYSAMWGFIELELSLLENPEIVFFLVGLLFFTAIVAGAYPSLYISKFRPVKILRGNLTLGGSSLFSRVLLGLQYLFTCVALIASLAFSNNASFQNELDIGFRKENIVAVRTENDAEYERFKNLAAQNSMVEELTGTTHHIGWWTYSRTLKNGDTELETSMMNIGLDYRSVMDLKVIKGRYFTEDLREYDAENSILVNEQTVEEFGWSDPIGQVVQVDDSTRLNVVGVINNFYMYGFTTPVRPTGFRLAKEENSNFVVIKSQTDAKTLYEELETTWYSVAPNTPFNAEFRNENISESNEINMNITYLFRFLGFVALVLSSIGLYTLVSLNVLKRVKEIGVRKVLGATVQQILIMVNKQFTILMLLALAAGAALSYYAVDGIMALIFSVYEVVTPWTIGLPVVIMLALALSIASGRVLKTARRNPVDSLRYE